MSPRSTSDETISETTVRFSFIFSRISGLARHEGYLVFRFWYAQILLKKWFNMGVLLPIIWSLFRLTELGITSRWFKLLGFKSLGDRTGSRKRLRVFLSVLLRMCWKRLNRDYLQIMIKYRFRSFRVVLLVFYEDCPSLVLSQLFSKFISILLPRWGYLLSIAGW